MEITCSCDSNRFFCCCFYFVFVVFVSSKKEGRSIFELIASVSVVDTMFQLGSLIKPRMNS